MLLSFSLCLILVIRNALLIIKVDSTYYCIFYFPFKVISYQFGIHSYNLSYFSGLNIEIVPLFCSSIINCGDMQ